ncbi:hypothetical protein FB446DRAFT_246350 [Lentinula raphanica]|nr:hypothetical protein FB446DRAFT_246350 [Lentinula raphanica]
MLWLILFLQEAQASAEGGSTCIRWSSEGLMMLAASVKWGMCEEIELWNILTAICSANHRKHENRRSPRYDSSQPAKALQLG